MRSGHGSVPPRGSAIDHYVVAALRLCGVQTPAIITADNAEVAQRKLEIAQPDLYRPNRGDIKGT